MTVRPSTTRARPALRVDVAALERRAQAEPLATLAEIARLRGEPSAADSPALLGRVAGLALLELGHLERAARELEGAIRGAAESGETTTYAAALGTLALVQLHQGDLSAVRGSIETVLPLLRGRERARTLMRLSLLQYRTGDASLALATNSIALRIARRCGDRDAVVRSLNNRGVFALTLGDLHIAERSFSNAERLAADEGDSATIVRARSNLGVVALRRGELVSGLSLLRESIGTFRATASAMALSEALLDQAEALVGASLLDEAEEAVAESIALARRAGSSTVVADAELRAAQVRLLRNDHNGALALARSSALAFGKQQRLPMRERAELVALAAAALSGQPLTRADRARLRAEGHDHSQHVVDARLAAARAALRARRPSSAAAFVQPLAALTRSPSALARISGYEALAVLAILRRDPAAAQRAVRSGMRVASTYATALASTELRLGAAKRVEALGRLGLELAVDRGAAAGIVDAIEGAARCRFQTGFGSSRVPTATARDLGTLRSVLRRLDEPGITPVRESQLRRRQRDLEQRIRDTSRSTTARPARLGIAGVQEPAQCRVASGTAILFGETESALVRGVRKGKRCMAAVVPLSLVELEGLMDRIRFFVRRLTGPQAGDASAELHALLQRVDREILGDALSDEGEVTIVPPRCLRGMPWSAVPRLAGRIVRIEASLGGASVAPVPRPLRSVLTVAGPDLAYATAEAIEIAGIHGGRAITEDRARVPAILAAIAKTDLLHVAAHGTSRADNPAMSSLRVADGPLTVFDLESAALVPSIVVLSACDLGGGEGRLGGPLSGFVAALRAGGARCVVGAVGPVDDAATKDLMRAFHEGVHSGLGPAEALARAQERSSGPTDRLFCSWGL